MSENNARKCYELLITNMWRILRIKTLVLTIACLLIWRILVFGISLERTHLRHYDQFLIRWSASPVVIDEHPDFTEANDKEEQGLCPKKPPGLEMKVNNDLTVTDLDAVSQKYTPYKPGGHFKPDSCTSRTKTAVIIPFRNRERHLVVLINHLVPFLVRQQAEFAIFVIEPTGPVLFNRALLLNAGFIEALKTNNFTCFIFHDVDLLPESDFNLYRCGKNPRHMAVANSKYEYELPFSLYSGGVFSMSREVYEHINGHSNLFFGWGGEDDDLLYRLAYRDYPITRQPANICRYTAIFHEPDQGNEVSNLRYQLLWTTEKRMFEEGLNSLRYQKIKEEKLQLYTKIIINFDSKYYE